MATQPTQNSVPSESPRDLKFNAGKIDEFVTSDNHEYVDRFGGKHRTISGINYDANQAILNYGYITKDSFEDGSTLSLANECLRFEATGEYYRWDGDLPKVVPPGSTPDSTGGIGAGDWLSVGYAALKQQLASSSSGMGDALSAVKQATPNSVLLTQHDINLQTVSIQQYGGKDDYNGTSGTNSWSALQNIIADYPGGCRIRMPKTVGGTGRYFMSGTGGSADMSKYSLDIDPGVDVTHTGTNTPLIGPGLVVNRELKIKLTTLGYTYHLSPTPYGGVSGKPYVLSAGDGEAPIVERTYTDTEMSFLIVRPDNGVITAGTGYTDGNGASFDNIPGGHLQVGVFAARPGWEYHARVAMPGSAAAAVAYIQQENGWVAYTQSLAGGAITRFVFDEGFPVQQTTGPSPIADNPAYALGVADIGIKIHSPTSFSLLSNGAEIARMDQLTSPIIAAGWGLGFTANSSIAYIADTSRIRRNRVYAMRPLSIVAVGDSTGDKTNPFSWVNHAVRIASGTGGIQFKKVLNQAVAGQTAVQQAAIFNATDFQALGGFDFALIDVGINDISGGSTVTQFIDAIVSMINTARTYNMTPIIGIPAMYYDQAAAAPYGQTGQGSSGASNGAPYRLQLLRKLAELGIQAAVVPMENMGAIVPSLLGNTALDPVVQDNVHQSGWGGELKGMGWAQALVGYLYARTRKDLSVRTVKTAWIPTALQATYGNTIRPMFSVTENEFSMTSAMNVPASVPNNTTILQLPRAYAPREQRYVPVSCMDSGGAFIAATATAQISALGAITLHSVPATAVRIYFGNIHYTLPD